MTNVPYLVIKFFLFLLVLRFRLKKEKQLTRWESLQSVGTEGVSSVWLLTKGPEAVQ